MLVDTHCHLSSSPLSEQLAGVLAAAAAAGVDRLVTIATDVEDHPRALAIANSHSPVFAALGIHPHSAGETEKGYEALLEQRLRMEKKVVALGECGLDYFHHYCPKSLQQRVFITQLELATRVDLPVILHIRDAHADGLAIMKDFAHLRFVVHCFTGKPAECEGWLALGAFIGITGIVTYKNAQDVRDSAKLVPPDRLLLETDAPYLSPEPVRAVKPNQPAHVAHTAKFLGDLRGVSSEDFARQTTENAARFYGARLFE